MLKNQKTYSGKTKHVRKEPRLRACSCYGSARRSVRAGGQRRQLPGPHERLQRRQRPDVSGNQLPLQACNNDIPINGLLGIQVPLSGLSGALGLLNTAPVTSSADRTCTQTPGQTNPTTVNTNS